LIITLLKYLSRILSTARRREPGPRLSKRGGAAVKLSFLALTYFAACATLAAQAIAPAGDAPAAPVWIAPPVQSTAGYFSLSWRDSDSKANSRFELQEAANAEFENARSLYRGPETASTISGKANGDFYYRVRIIARSAREVEAADVTPLSAWSDVHSVRVEHHALSRAFAFLLLGAAVFLSTAVLILRGYAKERDAEAGSLKR
jgi:hypothetical protein